MTVIAPAKQALAKAFDDVDQVLEQLQAKASTAQARAEVEEGRALLGKVRPVIAEVTRLWEAGEGEAAVRISAR
jgi:hypothetical protein